MTNAKRILITTSIREIFIIRKIASGTLREPCAECAADVQMLTLDEAVTLTGTSTRELMWRAAAGQIHSVETASGHLIICKRSLGDLSNIEEIP